MTDSNKKPDVGDIQVDPDGSEWVIVDKPYSGVSRVRRNSMAHHVLSEKSEVIRQSLEENDASEKPETT